MTTIVLRSNTPNGLTNAQVDANFTNLNNDKVEYTDCTSANLGNRIVRRDSYGDFATRNIIASAISVGNLDATIGQFGTVDVQDRGFKIASLDQLAITSVIGYNNSSNINLVTSYSQASSVVSVGDIIKIYNAGMSTGNQDLLNINGSWVVQAVSGNYIMLSIGTSFLSSGSYSNDFGVIARMSSSFFGLDRSTGKFTFIPRATDPLGNGVYSGTKGTIDAYIEWNDVLNKPVSPTFGTGLYVSNTVDPITSTVSVVYGTTAGTCVQGNDSRLSDARTPLAHSHAASDITSGVIAAERLGTGSASTSTFLRGDGTWATVSGLPLQIGNAGKYLTTNGTTASWSTIATGATLSDTVSGTNLYLTMANDVSGTYNTAYVSSSALYFNPNSGQLNATSFNSLSDIRYKHDLEQIENALSKVKSLSGYTFSMIESNTRSAGLIAQDVEKVLPEAIGGSEDKLTVSYGALMGLIVEAIKELDSKLTDIRNHCLDK